jgi:CheY-like chemotaxis protein
MLFAAICGMLASTWAFARDLEEIRVEVSASTILVVNDRAAARGALVAVLEGEGFAVIAYASAAECLANCDFRQVACAIVRHDMGEMTGLELAKVFQSGWLAIPTILLADTLAGSPQDRAAAGVIAVLGLQPKPADLCPLLRGTNAAMSQVVG